MGKGAEEQGGMRRSAEVQEECGGRKSDDECDGVRRVREECGGFGRSAAKWGGVRRSS